MEVESEDSSGEEEVKSRADWSPDARSEGSDHDENEIMSPEWSESGSDSAKDHKMFEELRHLREMGQHFHLA